MESFSSSSSSKTNDSSSDSDVLLQHELEYKINLGLANANSTANDSYKGSLAAIKTDSVPVASDPNIDLGSNENEDTMKECNEPIASSLTCKLIAQENVNNGNTLKQSRITVGEPLLQRNDSLEKVIQVLESKSFVKPQPSISPTYESLPKDRLTLNAETLLILNLLGMKSADRHQYLIDIAKKRKLLLTNERTNTFNVNPELLVANNLPQVVDFVHQFQGKPIELSEPAKTDNLTENTTQTSERQLKKKAKEEMDRKVRKQKQHEKKKIASLSSGGQVVKLTPLDQASLRNNKTILQSNLPTVNRNASMTPVKSSTSTLSIPPKAATTSLANKIVATTKGKQRKHSSSESTLLFQAVDSSTHRHDVAEAFSKRQQRRLVKLMKTTSIEANLEKAPRKRGRRGSKKGTEELLMKEESSKSANDAKSNKIPILSKTDIVAKNLIRSKCSQINADIKEKLNSYASAAEPGPSKMSVNRSDDYDLVIEKIVNQSDDDDVDSSSVTSDSSNFPTDEETTSYFARSDEMESSCNEKRSDSTLITKLTKATEKIDLNDGVTAPFKLGTNSAMNVRTDNPVEETVMQRSETVTQPLSSLKTTQTSSSTSKVNNESLLIMSLLTMSDRDRDAFIEKAAVDFNIFIKKQDKTVLNHRLSKALNVFTSAPIIKFIQNHKVKEKEYFESEVIQLVRRYVSDQDLYKYDLPRSANKKIISSFAARLVAENLGRIIEGDVRINEYDNTEAYMTNEDDDRDVFFSSILLRRCALHCTRVKAFVFTADERSVQLNGKRIVRGFVMELLDDQSRQIVGRFDLKQSTLASMVFIPDDRRVPRVKIDANSDPKLVSKKFLPKDDSLYLVQLKYWKEKRPFGVVVEEIGKADELETGNRAVLLKNGLKPLVFTKSIMEALPKEPFVIPENEYKTREVLTKDCIFTIDPITARDLDDAVSCKKLENGNYEIGVHISDVSHFVIENSDLDNMIKDQTTTIYLVNTVYHMLPRELCMLCSLLPGQDKLTFSVFWEMTPDAKILSTRFAKTIINSCVQLAYEHAQLFIDQPNREFGDTDLPQLHNGFKCRDLSNIVNSLNSLAVILRKDRFDNGCISINQTKIIFDLNEHGNPIAFRPAERNESNFLIEEFMLLANQSVAKFIYEKFPYIAVLRNHAPPKVNMMEELVGKMNSLKYHMDISSSKAISDSITKVIRSSGNNDAVSSVLNSMLAKPMVRAEYFCSSHIKTAKSLVHFALSIPIYTHFTSPIRRYPDILVHRLLAAGLSLAPIPTRTPDELKLIMRNCNDQKYNAKLAGDDSTNLYFLHYLRAFGPIKMRAAVRELSKGTELHVMLIDSGHNVRINLKQNVPELKFECPDNGVPTIQFEDLPAIPVNIFDVVYVEIFEKKDYLKGNLVPK